MNLEEKKELDKILDKIVHIMNVDLSNALRMLVDHFAPERPEALFVIDEARNKLAHLTGDVSRLIFKEPAN